jgi:hypothetical protein
VKWELFRQQPDDFLFADDAGVVKRWLESKCRSAAASLIPNLDLVAIRVGDVGVGAARAEFAPPEQLAKRITSRLKALRCGHECVR